MICVVKTGQLFTKQNTGILELSSIASNCSCCSKS